MQFYNYINTKLPFFVALSFTFVLASCGSYQYVGYDNDGIYQERQVVYEDATNVETETPSSDAESNSYFKNYFNDKANQYSDIPDDERIIFTDIDSYEGTYAEEYEEEDSQDGYAGWGQASNNITINYIDYGWGFNDPWLWNGAWGWRYGWNNYYGWNHWGWNAGWGYNYWCPPGFNGYYYNNHNLAYNSGRRGSNLAYGNRNSISRRNSSTISRRNSTINRNNNVTRSTTRRNNNATRTTTRRNNNSTVRRNTTRTRSTNTRSNSNVTRSRSNSTRSSTRMSTTPRRSNSSSVRSSGNTSSRSSGTSRSSSSGGNGRRR
jgi:hypothetical protein